MSAAVMMLRGALRGSVGCMVGGAARVAWARRAVGIVEGKEGCDLFAVAGAFSPLTAWPAPLRVLTM